MRESRHDLAAIETWAREGLVDVLVLGTRTIHVDVASSRKAMGDAHVKRMPSFDCFHATDGYHGDQSLDLVCGVFGNYFHQGADGVGALVRNTAAQKLTRMAFLVPAESLKRGDNSITISVSRRGPFPASKAVKVEKVELHLK